MGMGKACVERVALFGYQYGQRMRMSAHGIARSLRGPRTGQLVGIAESGLLYILRDGRKTPCRYSPRFWERADT